jgi:drug/metabolite transporter (DMT)-like permease
MSHNITQGSAIDVRRSIRRATIVATAAAANALAWVGGRQAHVDYIVQTPLGARQITLVLVIVATAVSGLAGWAVYRQLERRTSNAVRAWVVLAMVVLALSIAPIFVLPAHMSTRLTLTALHCLAAAILVAGLPQSR